MLTTEALFVIVLVFSAITVLTFLAILLRHIVLVILRSLRLIRQRHFSSIIDKTLFERSVDKSFSIPPIELKNPIDAFILQNVISRRLFIVKGDLGHVLTRFAEHSGLVKKHVRKLKSRSKSHRRVSTNILGDMGSKTAVFPLIVSLRDPDEDVRAISAQSLGELKAESVIEFIASLFQDIDDSRCYKVADTLITFGEQAVPVLAKHVTHKERKVRYWTTRCISLIKPDDPDDDYKEVAGLLAERARVENCHRVKSVMSKVISNSHRKELLPAIMKLSTDDGPVVREKAAEALGQLKNEAAIDRLIEMFSDPVWEVNYAASRGLLEFESKGLDAVERALPGLQGIAKERSIEILIMKGRMVA